VSDPGLGRSAGDPILLVTGLVGAYVAGSLVLSTGVVRDLPPANLSRAAEPFIAVAVGIALTLLPELRRYGWFLAGLGVLAQWTVLPHLAGSTTVDDLDGIALAGGIMGGLVVGGVLLSLARGTAAERVATATGFAFGLVTGTTAVMNEILDITGTHDPTISSAVLALLLVVPGLAVVARGGRVSTSDSGPVRGGAGWADVLVVVLLAAGALYVHRLDVGDQQTNQLAFDPPSVHSGVDILLIYVTVIGIAAILAGLAILRGGPAGGRWVVAMVGLFGSFVAVSLVYPFGLPGAVGFLAVLVAVATGGLAVWLGNWNVPWDGIGLAVLAAAVGSFVNDATSSALYRSYTEFIGLGLAATISAGFVVGASLTRLVILSTHSGRSRSLGALIGLGLVTAAVIRMLGETIGQSQVRVSDPFQLDWVWPAAAAAVIIGLSVIGSVSSRRRARVEVVEPPAAAPTPEPVG
jgi:hypothetical protein